jgi:hypothetical protein
MGPNFNIFDPSQWANVTGFIVVAVMAVLSLVVVGFKIAASGKWYDWLGEAHGRGSVEDEWEDDGTPPNRTRRYRA